MSLFIGCLICGVKKDLSSFPDCAGEAKDKGIYLVAGVTGDHIWTEAKEVEWEGK